jgi:DNA-binding MarR family transcriptional regulator
MSGRALELISAIHLDWKRRVARDLAPHGIGPKQIFLLRRLSEAGTLSPSDVADLLHGDRPSATSMLNTLERAGWIRRERDPQDGKRIRVTLTPEGGQKLASVPESLWRSGRTCLDPEACLDPAERKELIRLLTRIHQSLER